MNPGYVYACRVRDAVDVTASFTTPRYPEFELSAAGGIEWRDVVAWRKFRWVKDLRGGNIIQWESPVSLTTDTTVLPNRKRAELLRHLSLPMALIHPTGVSNCPDVDD